MSSAAGSTGSKRCRQSLWVVALFGLLGAAACSSPQRQGHVSRADFGDAWPLTVDEGELSCDQTGSSRGAVVFEAGGTRYGLNGTATRRGYPAIDPIWKYNGPLRELPVVERLSELERQRIFAALVACEDLGSGGDHHNACRVESGRRNHLTTEELTQISIEGVALGWPPLKRTRANIRPLLNRGLAMCKR
jgi:hypothetical protein